MNHNNITMLKPSHFTILNVNRATLFASSKKNSNITIFTQRTTFSTFSPLFRSKAPVAFYMLREGTYKLIYKMTRFGLKTFAPLASYASYPFESSPRAKLLSASQPIWKNSPFTIAFRNRYIPLTLSRSFNSSRSEDHIKFEPLYDSDDPSLNNSDTFTSLQVEDLNLNIYKRLGLLSDEDRKKVKKYIYGMKK